MAEAIVTKNSGEVEFTRNNLPEETTMADESMAFAEYIRQQGGENFLKDVVEVVLAQRMDYEVGHQIGAGLHERGGARQAHRNGYRERILHTRLGTLALPIPKLRSGSYFPSFLEPRRLSEKAIAAVIQEAWVGGVSTRKMDELVKARGGEGIFKSQVSKLCGQIDARNRRRRGQGKPDTFDFLGFTHCCGKTRRASSWCCGSPVPSACAASCRP
jgi:hypothetical protein